MLEDSTSISPITVSELTARIRQLLEQGFSQLKVVGEVSRLVQHSSGHMYFTIKDSGAVLSAVIWRSTLARMTLQPEDGQEYIFTGHISVYEPRGAYQLIIRRVELSGSGALAAEFERKKALFAERGWFDTGRKQPIPELPRHIGIVTSENAAALQDINKVLASRPGWLRRTLSPAAVQGVAAAKDIARAIRRLEQMDSKPDVILIARGGGSMEDLWCFNEEAVVQAIVECPIPVITGIGHEIDATLADFAANKRAATPSNAAELACPDKDSLRANLPRLTALRQLLQQNIAHGRKGFSHLRVRAEHGWRLNQDRRYMHAERVTAQLAHACSEPIKRQRLQLGDLIQRLTGQQPHTQSARRERQLSAVRQRLQDTMQHLIWHRHTLIKHCMHSLNLGLAHDIQRRQGLAAALAGQLETLSPYQVLARGYALCTDKHHRLITRRAALRPGQEINLLYHDGETRAYIDATPDGTA